MENTNSWFKDKMLLGMTPKEYIKSNLTIANLIIALILCVSIPVFFYRIFYGIGPSTNLSDNYPWGLWIGFDLLTIATAPGLTIATAVYLFGMEKYHPFARPAILASLLGYIFAVLVLMLDLGRYYRVHYMLMWSWGFTSILFLVGWHFFLYIDLSVVELAPVFLDWLGLKNWRDFFTKLTVWAVIFGVLIAAGHQSALGALYLVAVTKLYPLWYSPFLPIFFLLSAIFGGIGMVVIVNYLAYKIFIKHVRHFDQAEFDHITIGLGKAAASGLFIYLILKIFDLVRTGNFVYLDSPYGYLYLFEILGFVLVPIILFVVSVRNQSAKLSGIGSLITVLGVILNRVDVSMVAYNWYIPFSEKYYPKWTEITLTVGAVTVLIMCYRFIVNRMAIMHEFEESNTQSTAVEEKKQVANL